MSLVLSLFPGIGLLDMAFEQEGFCVVRGPDLLWGGDIRRFHPPAGRFDGVIGGPPCQMFSTMKRRVPNAGEKQGNLIPEFERVVRQAQPMWALMENVEGAPKPQIDGYAVYDQLIRDVWCGGETTRLKRFSFGARVIMPMPVIETEALHRPDPEPAALAAGGRRERTRVTRTGERRRYTEGYKTEVDFRNHCRLQGLPEGFDIPPFRTAAKVKAIGNGVPLAMGRAVARAVKRAVCTCLADVCDCQAYPTHVSEECPIHNRKPMPMDTCPVHGTSSLSAGQRE